MIGLAIHTSSPALGLAIIDTTAGERHQVWPLGRDLTTYLHPCLSDFVAPYPWHDLSFVAVAKGPGGFTGTRIGVTVARTLAQQLNIPLFGVSSLAAIAQQQLLSGSTAAELPPFWAVTLAARRDEVFGAIYQHTEGGLIAALPDAVYSQASWSHVLSSWSAPYQLIQAEDSLATSVVGVLAWAQQRWQRGDRPDWQTVLPFYGQHPVRQ